MSKIRKNPAYGKIASLLQTAQNSMKEIERLESLEYTNILALVDAYIKLAKAYSTLPGEECNEIALQYYKTALENVHSDDYPTEMRSDTLQEIHKALDALEKNTKTAYSLTRKDQETIGWLTDVAQETYDGFWVQPKAWSIPVTEIFLAAALCLAWIFHAPLASYIHAGPLYQCPSTSQSISVNGSTALLPLLQLAERAYTSMCGSNVHISLNPDKNAQGGMNGLNQLLDGKVDVAATDAYVDPSLKAGLKDNSVAVAVFALVVNKKSVQVSGNPITSLTDQQIASIYNGVVSNWQELDKNFSNQDLSVVARPPSSQVRQLFEKYVLGNTEAVLGPPDTLSDVDGDIASKVCSTPGAIGYISLYYYHYYQEHGNNCLSVIAIDNYSPLDTKSLKQPQDPQKPPPYLFWSLEHLYYKSDTSIGLTKDFVDYIFSDTMKPYIQQYDKYGYLPVPTSTFSFSFPLTNYAPLSEYVLEHH